jgi:hypothetical protein
LLARQHPRAASRVQCTYSSCLHFFFFLPIQKLPGRQRSSSSSSSSSTWELLITADTANLFPPRPHPSSATLSVCASCISLSPSLSLSLSFLFLPLPRRPACSPSKPASKQAAAPTIPSPRIHSLPPQPVPSNTGATLSAAINETTTPPLVADDDTESHPPSTPPPLPPPHAASSTP